MIEKMTKYSFILLNGEQENFLKNLQELGVVDITRSTKPVDAASENLLSQSESYKKAIAHLSSFELEEELAGKASSLKMPKINDPVSETFETIGRLEELETRLSEVKKEFERLRPWGDFDQDAIEKLSALGYKLRYYKVSKKRFSESWAETYPLVIISEDKLNIYFVTVSNEEDYVFPISESEAPKKNRESIEKEEAGLNEEILFSKAKLFRLNDFLPEIKNNYRKTLGDLDLYLADVSAEKAAENHIYVFEGFAPAKEDERLSEAFDKMDVFYQKEEAKKEDNPPISLKNNKFNKMFEVLTDMYGRPGYDGFDPTPYIAVFFLLFFAFCMGDAGYGLILMLVGFLLKKTKAGAKMAPLVIVLGAATLVIGFIFHNFFSMDIMEWGCIPDGVKKIMLPTKIAGYDGTMVLALAMGVVHICIALIVKTIYSTKQKGFLNSLGTWGWTLLIVGGVVLGGISLTGALSSNITKWAIIALGTISAIGIFLLNDLRRNPLKNIGAGLWETYNTATGLLGDVLSYLRLYALGLAGSMLGYAFNDLGKMVLGDGGFGFNWLAFLLIVIIGHSLNLAMAALGAFVHPLRLNFLEFFKNSGYEAEGRNYNPLVKSNNKQ